MPHYRFAVTAPATMTALVTIEAENIEAAHDMALVPSFYRDQSRVLFEFDPDNVPYDAYLPDDEVFEVIENPELRSASKLALQDFWFGSEMVNDFVETFAAGGKPSGAGFDGNRLVLMNGDRDKVAVVCVVGDVYEARSTNDPMTLIDTEAEYDSVSRYANVEDAFLAAVVLIGHDPEDIATKSPFP